MMIMVFPTQMGATQLVRLKMDGIAQAFLVYVIPHAPMALWPELNFVMMRI